MSECLPPEYIVAFKGYYSQQARAHFLTAALRGCCEDGSWRIVPRQNPGRNFPSDFSLVELRMANVSTCLASLSSHPLVRSINPHRKLSHTLRCSDKKSFGHSSSRMSLMSVCSLNVMCRDTVSSSVSLGDWLQAEVDCWTTTAESCSPTDHFSFTCRYPVGNGVHWAGSQGH